MQASSSTAQLHLKVMDVRHGSIRICGHSRKDSISHAVFDLDPNYSFPVSGTGVASGAGGPRDTYTPTDKRYRVEGLADAGDDCVKLTGIPAGNHVLTVHTDPKHPTHVTTVSHLIVF
jgi:hypothetical protein